MWVIHLNKRNSYPATVIKRVPELSTDVALTSANHDEEDTLLRKQQAAPQQFSCSWLTIVVLLAVVSQICSIDRMAMSVAVLPMSDEYGWPNSVKGAVNGWVLSRAAVNIACRKTTPLAARQQSATTPLTVPDPLM